MIGQWRNLLTKEELEAVDYIVFKCDSHPTLCSHRELATKKLADLLEAIHFAMAPLSEAPEYAVLTKVRIKEILKYE